MCAVALKRRISQSSIAAVSGAKLAPFPGFITPCDAQHGLFCWTRCVGQGDERLHRGWLHEDGTRAPADRADDRGPAAGGAGGIDASASAMTARNTVHYDLRFGRRRGRQQFRGVPPLHRGENAHAPLRLRAHREHGPCAVSGCRALQYRLRAGRHGREGGGRERPNSKAGKKNQRATASTDIARRTPGHRRTHRSAITATMPAPQKMDLQRKAA
jgi:hypothetical protein